MVMYSAKSERNTGPIIRALRQLLWSVGPQSFSDYLDGINHRAFPDILKNETELASSRGIMQDLKEARLMVGIRFVKFSLSADRIVFWKGAFDEDVDVPVAVAFAMRVYPIAVYVGYDYIRDAIFVSGRMVSGILLKERNGVL